MYQKNTIASIKNNTDSVETMNRSNGNVWLGIILSDEYSHSGENNKLKILHPGVYPRVLFRFTNCFKYMMSFLIHRLHNIPKT